MEIIKSRKNQYISHIRQLSAENEYRRDCGEYVCDGMKTLREALAFGAEVRLVLWKERAEDMEGLESAEQFLLPEELFDYASPMKNSPGPLFTVKIPAEDRESPITKCIILENVQDPGNVGTVIRTANAFGIDAVILSGACADLYHPRTVRATMGAVFRQRILHADLEGLRAITEKNALPLYGAALRESAADIRSVPLKNAAVAIGSEGRGLSEELLSLCDKAVIIPMCPDSESLNAGVAASVVMWEMAR